MATLSNVLFYVKDLEGTLAFYEKAFGVKTAFVDETGVYAQLDTGTTALGFVKLEFAKANLGKEVVELDGEKPPHAMEIAFAVEDVDGVYKQALEAGAVAVSEPADKPWGQRDGYVRDPNGILIEICSPMVAACDDNSCGCG